MYESYDFIDEGVIYGKIVEIKKDKICIEANGKVKCFDKKLFNCNKDDYVRFYVKKDDILFLEVIDKELYDGLRDIINNL